MTEQDRLLKSVLNGEKNAYQAIVLKYQQPIYAYLIHLVKDPFDAENLLQEVFIAAYRSLHTYRFNDRFSPWLYRIGHNKAINHLKKKSRMTSINMLEDTIAVAQPEDTIELDPELDKAIHNLNPSERSILYLRVFEEMSYDDISKIMKISPFTLRKKYERLRAKLKKNIEQGRRTAHD